MDPLEAIRHTGDYCDWPNAQAAGRTRMQTAHHKGAWKSHDTTQLHMGRRQQAVCQGYGCLKRVDKPGDDLCRLCKRGR